MSIINSWRDISLENMVSKEERDRKHIKFIFSSTPGMIFREKIEVYFNKNAIKSGIDYLGYLAKDLKNYILGNKVMFSIS